jgi:hypothetical protein
MDTTRIQIQNNNPLSNKYMRRMNRGVLTNVPRESIAKAIWEGTAIMGTDGSVRDQLANCSFVISLSQTNVATCAKGGGFLPITALYLDPYSQLTEAAALFSGLCWIKALLDRFPNPSNTQPPTLPIPIDNKAIMTDVNRFLSAQTPTFDLLSPDYDILQAIHKIRCTLPIDIEPGMNLTHMLKSMSLLMNKLKKFTTRTQQTPASFLCGFLGRGLPYITTTDK